MHSDTLSIESLNHNTLLTSAESRSSVQCLVAEIFFAIALGHPELSYSCKAQLDCGDGDP